MGFSGVLPLGVFAFVGFLESPGIRPFEPTLVSEFRCIIYIQTKPSIRVLEAEKGIPREVTGHQVMRHL